MRDLTDPHHPAAPDHTPVLLERTLELLDPGPGQTWLDLTAGLGGHSAAAAPRLAPGGRVILVDLDPGNLALAEARVRATAPSGVEVIAWAANFSAAPDRLRALGWRADAALADLGFASSQVDNPARGLSFTRDGPLDMRLDPHGPITAAELIATVPEAELARLIREYGDERFAGRIARRIVERRAERPIDRTADLAEIIKRAVPPPSGGSKGRRHGPRIHPATRTFQALRIAVNDELGSLERLLEHLRRPLEWLNPGARVGLIAFHSLEDRPIKHALAGLAESGIAERLTRKPAVAEDAEVAANPRSRSAKLRAIRVIAGVAGGAGENRPV